MLKKVGDIGKQGNLIYSMKSDSTDEVYELRTIESSSYYSCSCLGYATSKRRPRICKHIRRYFLIQELKGMVKHLELYNDGYELVDKFPEQVWVDKAKAVERLFKKEV